MKRQLLKMCAACLLCVPLALMQGAELKQVNASEQKLAWQQRRAEILAERDRVIAQEVPVIKEQPRVQVDPSPIPLPSEALAKEGVPLPTRIQLSVPFSAQAPHGNWDLPYQEACEEMSLIMLDYFHRGQPLTPEQADAHIVHMVEWEERFGYGESITMAELAGLLENYYGHYQARLIHDVSVASIKRELAAGNPVIVPTAGRVLQNPYFTNGGPWYHMLVITGYDDTHFITNDPGTGLGEGYRYTHEVLLDAIHDWTGVPEEIEQGRAVMMVVET